jgi:hypothetical protein
MIIFQRWSVYDIHKESLELGVLTLILRSSHPFLITSPQIMHTIFAIG